MAAVAAQLKLPKVARRFLAAAACAMLALGSGCSSSSAPMLGDYLEELDLEAPSERRAEVPVGKYRIPIALRDKNNNVEWRLFTFELFAVTSPSNETAVEAAWERRKGQFRDSVLTICRGISADELSDQRHAGLKSQLVDMARPLLGASRVHHLLLVAATIEPL